MNTISTDFCVEYSGDSKMGCHFWRIWNGCIAGYNQHYWCGCKPRNGGFTTHASSQTTGTPWLYTENYWIFGSQFLPTLCLSHSKFVLWISLDQQIEIKDSQISITIPRPREPLQPLISLIWGQFGHATSTSCPRCLQNGLVLLLELTLADQQHPLP